ncbi:40710_t:CDS:2, partial [Gigaspora margarita]
EITKVYREFDYNEFKFLRNISDGSSEINLFYMKTIEHVVLKFLKYNNPDEYYRRFRTEIMNLTKIWQNDNVNNVIKFYGVTKEPSKKFHSMVLQYCFGKNLKEYLKEKKFSDGDWFYKKRIATEIATGLKFIHEANVVHCDLNSKNIMIHGGKSVIIDFSSSMSLESQTEPTLKITKENVAYVDPKFFNPTCNDNNYDKYSDIYSLGVIFWEISSGRAPFSDKSELKDIKKLKTFLALENREDPVNLTPVDYKELYCDSWNPDPKKRPSIDKVISHLKSIEFECVYQNSNYIPEIFFGIAFWNIFQSTSKDSACLAVTKESAVIKESSQNTYIFLPQGEISVGRSNLNDVIVRDQEIAKEHATIIVNDQGVEIIDLGSDSGIFINGEKLDFRTSYSLTKDDVISIGRSEFQYLPAREYKNRMDNFLWIYNYDYFMERLKNEFRNAKENNRNLSLLFFDLNHFKSINDQMGHIAGNYALKELANLIQKNHIRSEDIFARYGGDEFTILLKDADINLAFKIAEEIRASVEGHAFIYNEIRLSVTLSIGVSEMNSSVKTCDELLLYADNALKKAKEDCIRVVIWNNEVDSIQNCVKESHFKSDDDECYSTESLSSFSSTMDDEIGITIIKSDSENKRPEYTYLPQNKTLNFIRTELKLGTNFYFLIKKNGARISQKDESKLNLLQIIETSNDEHFLYIAKESAEFDLLQLKYEKGLKFGADGSIENAEDKAFEIDIDKVKFLDSRCDRRDKTNICDHALSANCKRGLIIDEKISDALKWVCCSLKLSQLNSKVSTIHFCEWRPKKEIIISDISATDEFIKDVEAALKCKDIIKQLCNVSERYGHFYARRLVLGGMIVKNSSHAKNSDEDGFNTKVWNTHNFGGDNTEINVIGGDKNKYFQDMKYWDESLKDAFAWKIIGYDKIYSLFELLNENLQKEVLRALGHRILKAGSKDINFDLRNSSNSIPPYIHNLSPDIKEIENVPNCQVFASIMSKSDKNLFSAHIDYLNKDKNIPVIVVHNIKREHSCSTTCLIKLGWIIVGPLTNFDFKVRFPLVVKIMKQSVKHIASLKENHSTIKINNYKPCILGICAIEVDSESSSISNNGKSQLSSESSVDSTESTEIIPYDLKYDPKKIEIVAGTHFSAYKELACLFVYNPKDINKPVDKKILKNLVLYTCVVDVDNHENFDFGQENAEWQSSEQEKISYTSIGSKKLSDNDLILVSQLFNNCPNCKHFGFVNVDYNTSRVIYKSLNSELLDSVENIAYLLIPLENKTKN